MDAGRQSELGSQLQQKPFDAHAIGFFQRNAADFDMGAHLRVKIPSGNITNLHRKLMDNE